MPEGEEGDRGSRPEKGRNVGGVEEGGLKKGDRDASMEGEMGGK